MILELNLDGDDASDAVGIYVPGGLASYPSSVLICNTSQSSWCKTCCNGVPTPHGKINPAVLYAAKVSGIDEIYRIEVRKLSQR